MNRHAFRGFEFVDERVGARPIAFRIPPKRGQGCCELMARGGLESSSNPSISLQECNNKQPFSNVKWKINAHLFILNAPRSDLKWRRAPAKLPTQKS